MKSRNYKCNRRKQHRYNSVKKTTRRGGRYGTVNLFPKYLSKFTFGALAKKSANDNSGPIAAKAKNLVEGYMRGNTYIDRNASIRNEFKPAPEYNKRVDWDKFLKTMKLSDKPTSISSVKEESPKVELSPIYNKLKHLMIHSSPVSSNKDSKRQLRSSASSRESSRTIKSARNSFDSSRSRGNP